MIYLYIGTLVLGGVLLASSMLLGEADADADGFDKDIPVDVGGTDASGFFVGLRSFRFWIFFSAFFGLTGLLLTGLGFVESPLVIAILATAMGASIGGIATALLRRLAFEEAGQIASDADYVGRTGRVLVAVSPTALGKVRISLGGTHVDTLALSVDDAIGVESEIVIVEMDGHTARVARLRTGE